MKKCASCSKDLPDAALHCVFCGAKQAQTPAVAQSNAKTAFGYSANEVMEQLGQQRANRPSQTPAPVQTRSPISAAEHDAATVLVPVTPQAGSPSFSQQQGFAATDYGSTPSPAARGPYGASSPPPNAPSAAPYSSSQAPYGSANAPYPGAPPPGFGNPSPAQSFGNPAPGYGNPSPAQSFGNPSPAQSFGNPSPGYGNQPAGYGNPSPAQSFGNPSPGYGNQPAGYGNPAPGSGNPSPAQGYGNPADAGNPSPAQSYGNPAPGYGNQAAGYGNPSPGYGAPSPGYNAPGGGMGIQAPRNLPTAPVTTLPAPYQARGGVTPGWPIDPWKDSIKLVMFVWGAVALVTFAAPLHADPYSFQWDIITDAPGKLKLAPLLWAAAGLLSIICAAIPMPTLPRGIVAAALGLSGMWVPLFIHDATPPPLDLIELAGTLVLVAGLLVRNEYTESIVPRILITVGVVAVLLHQLVPVHSEIPLVTMFKGIIDAPGTHKLEYVLDVVKVVLVVMTLLAWMPGPATGGGKLFAWALILFPIATFALALALDGHLGDVASKTPAKLVAWAPEVVFSILSGYGLATIIGKQLE